MHESAAHALIPDVEVSQSVLAEFREGHRMHAARALIRQQRINASTARLENSSRLMDGIGQLKYQIDGDLYFHMRAIHGADCWRDPAFLKAAERDGLIKRVKGVSEKIIIQRRDGIGESKYGTQELRKREKVKAHSGVLSSNGPSFPTAHLPVLNPSALSAQ